MRDTAGARKKGTSLAKGPAWLIGLGALALGITGWIFGSTSFTTHAMSGTVNGGTWLGLEGNGWTWALFAAGGVLLLLAAPMHWGAKTMALIVGLAFGAASVISLVDGDDVFGVAAANGLTALVLGAAAAVLLVIALLPRVGKKDKAADDRRETREREREPTGRAHEPDGRVDERTAVASSRRQDAHNRTTASTDEELSDRTDRVERTGRFDREPVAGAGEPVRSEPGAVPASERHRT
jgi:hypothetical protein